MVKKEAVTISEIWLRADEKIALIYQSPISNIWHFIKNQNFDIRTRRAASWDPVAYAFKVKHGTGEPSLRTGFGHNHTLQIYKKILTKNWPNFAKNADFDVLTGRAACQHSIASTYAI